METLLPIEFKSVDASGHVSGLAAGVGNIDHGGDRIMPGAFAATIAARGGSPLPMFRDHDRKKTLGAWTELRETAEGLEAKGQIALDSRDGADAYALVKVGGLRGLSIGYNAERKSFAGSVREIHQLKLHEISLVPIGMNERTGVRSVKSLPDVATIRTMLQDAGFSGREAKAMAGAAWRARNLADDDDEAAADIARLLEQSATRIAGL